MLSGHAGVSVNDCSRQKRRESNASTLARWIEELGYMVVFPDGSWIDFLEPTPKVHRPKQAAPLVARGGLEG